MADSPSDFPVKLDTTFDANQITKSAIFQKKNGCFPGIQIFQNLVY